MKLKHTLSIIILLFCFGFTFKNNNIQTGNTQKPRIYINDFKTEVTEGMYINCRKIKDMMAVLYLNDDMLTYDMFQMELHRFGDDGDVMVAYKTFEPNEKEYKKLYAQKDSVALKLFVEEDGYGFNTSDFKVNTLVFGLKSYVNDVFCSYKEKKHCTFYLVVKGYSKTGKTTKFGEEIYDAGKEITPKSNVFKNIDTTVK